MRAQLQQTAIFPDATIEWRKLKPGEAGWDYSRCLYAFKDRRTGEIVYLGKAGRQTVAQRFMCRRKDGLWEYMDENGIHECDMLLGEVFLDDGRRYSEKLLWDIERLLISAIRPCGNVSGIRSSGGRADLCVECIGRWPGGRRIYCYE